jgi:hypothetical protein
MSAMQDQPESLINAELASFMQGPVSIHIASTGSGLVPSQARAIGCVVSPSLRDLTLFVSRVQAPDLVADILAGGPVAAVFSQPLSHRTVQFKAPGAGVRQLLESEYAVADAYCDAFINEVAREGFARDMLAAMLHYPEDGLMAVTIVPTTAFSQTPGPRAGEPLGHTA